jgi:hypothetical protein
LQELEESVYWMKLLKESGVEPAFGLTGLMLEANELTAILVSGINRLKASKNGH